MVEQRQQNNNIYTKEKTIITTKEPTNNICVFETGLAKHNEEAKVGIQLNPKGLDFVLVASLSSLNSNTLIVQTISEEHT